MKSEPKRPGRPPKYKPDQVRAWRAAIKAGVSYRQVAKVYRVPLVTVFDACSGRTHNGVK